MVRGMLSPLGYRIAGAESQAAALRGVAHERFAVIVMDTRRESFDGYETAKRIREETGTEHADHLPHRLRGRRARDRGRLR